MSGQYSFNTPDPNAAPASAPAVSYSRATFGTPPVAPDSNAMDDSPIPKPPSCVWVGKLATTCTRNTILELFAPICGGKCNVILRQGTHSGAFQYYYASVQFRNAGPVAAALEMNGTVVEGVAIIVCLDVHDAV